MAKQMRIPDGNAFKLRIAGQIKTGEYVETADFSVVRNMIVNFVRRGREAQTSSVDGAGRIVVENDGSLARGVYGVELTGYYNGEPWRFYVKDVFQIVNENAESDEPTGVDNVPVYDVTVDVSFGGDGISAAFVESAVNMHNSDENSHPHILGELSGKVDDVLVDGESVVETDPVTGKRIVGFRKDQFGKVDDVKVNGESALNENNEAEITVPTKTSELDNDADFATNDDVDEKVAAHMVNEVNVSVDNTAPTGQPSAEKTFQDGVLDITFKNVKGEKGDPLTWNDLTEPQKASLKGAQGDSAVYNPENPDAPDFVMANETGNSTTKAMTQKAITDEVTVQTENQIDLSELTATNNYINISNQWATSSGGTQSILVPVTAGQVIFMQGHNTYESFYALLSSNDTSIPPAFVGMNGRQSLAVGEIANIVVPSGATYLYITTKIYPNDVIPILYEGKYLKERVEEKLGDIILQDLDFTSDNYPILENFIIGSQNTWVAATNAATTFIPVKAGRKYWVLRSSYYFTYAFVKSIPSGTIDGSTPDWADGYTSRRTVETPSLTRLDVPLDAVYLAYMSKYSGGSRQPTRLAKEISISEVVRETEKYVGKRTSYKDVIPLVIELHTAKVRSNVLSSNKDTDPTEGSEIESTLVDSPWAVMFPSSYTPFWKPTRVVAMLHGANGVVKDGVMGYTLSEWVEWRLRYISEGYAVIDINGVGITTGNADANSKHYGSPAAIETLNKAFAFLRENYNVADKMLIHGSSMGGALAQTYTKTYPENVLAVALFSPVNVMNSAVIKAGATLSPLWGYANSQEARADNYANYVGFAPLARCLAWKDGELSEMTWEHIDRGFGYVPSTGIDNPESADDYEPIDTFPVPVRVWHGTADANVAIAASKYTVEAFRRSGSQASLRICDGEAHDICTGSSSYVINEAIDFFKRYE